MKFKIGIIAVLFTSPVSTFAYLNFGNENIPSGIPAFRFGNDLVRSTLTLDLSAATTGSWNMPFPEGANMYAVYDPTNWVVVYRFWSLELKNCDVNFIPHPSGCPVVILATGIDINSRTTSQGVIFNVPSSVGGFKGGGLGSSGIAGSAGFGPGGGQYGGSTKSGPGSYATKPFESPTTSEGGTIYGNQEILPIVGGSGAGATIQKAGSGGGGAIMFLSMSSFEVTGRFSVLTRSEAVPSATHSSGSGGAIKIMAESINVSATEIPKTLDATATGIGGDGRIRLEYQIPPGSGWRLPACFPPASILQLPYVSGEQHAVKWLPNTTDRTATIVSVGGVVTPNDPKGKLEVPADINLASGSAQAVEVSCRNIPTDGSWFVKVRGVPRNGVAKVYDCSFISGNFVQSAWRCTIPFTDGNQVLQATSGKR